MSPTPLHALALTKRAGLRSRADNLPRPAADEVLQRVRERGRVTVNMKPSILEKFLESGRTKHAFEIAAERAAARGNDAAAELRELMPNHYERRVAFEAFAAGSRHFYYGALNVGNLGTPRYGRCCVVDGRPSTDSAPDPVWVAGDSLDVTRFPHFDAAAYGDHVAAHDVGPELAAVKLAEHAAPDLPLEEQICREDDYIEALSVSPLEIRYVEEIRVDRAHDDALQDRSLDRVLANEESPDDIDLHTWERIRDRAEKLRLWRPWP